MDGFEAGLRAAADYLLACDDYGDRYKAERILEIEPPASPAPALPESGVDEALAWMSANAPYKHACAVKAALATPAPAPAPAPADQRIRELEDALRPFARVAGPIKGEEGRISYLDAMIGKIDTDELSLFCPVGERGDSVEMWAEDFRYAYRVLKGGAPAPAPVDAVRLTEEDCRLLDKALTASTTPAYSIDPPASVDAAGLIAVIEQIKPGTFYHQREVGDLHGWCERTRLTLSTALAAAAEREAALVRDLEAARRSAKNNREGRLAEKARALAAEVRVTAVEAGELGISHADLCRLSRVFCNETWATTEQDIRIDAWLKAMIAARAAIRKETP